MIPFAAENEVQVFAYSPLCAGLLTGKYGEPPGTTPSRWRLDNDERYRRRFADVRPLPCNYFSTAAALGFTPAQLAVSWVMSHPSGIVIPIVGARTAQQLEELLGARPLDVETWRTVGAMFPSPPPATDRLEEAGQ